MSYTTLFFDLDDTLYPCSSGLWGAIRDRMGRYMADRIGLPEAQIPAIRRHYFETYGTTLRGLQKHHHVDTDEYLAYVHDLPLEQYIQPNPALHALLESLPQRRFIFTNADAAHARRVMQVVGVTDCFEQIIDIRAIDFACKPEPLSYLRALALAGDPAAQECVLLDDSSTNLAPARQMGFTTVRINPECTPDPAATYRVDSLLSLPQVFPALWNGSGATFDDQ
jgi:putative hydrolase of the HAD superfamily